MNDRNERLYVWVHAGQTQRQMAAGLGITKQRVNQLLQRLGLLDTYRVVQWQLMAIKRHRPPCVCEWCGEVIEGKRRKLHPECYIAKCREYNRERNRLRYQTDPDYRAAHREWQRANPDKVRLYTQRCLAKKKASTP